MQDLSSAILTPQMPESLKLTSPPLQTSKRLIPGLGSQPALGRVGQATLVELFALYLR